MRVIAGTAKGHPLIAPKGMDTRPVTARIKEALFSIWQMRIAGSRFLDLFAGSGSIGIEALSRGAEKVVFVEQSRKAVGIIKKNLAVCHLETGYEINQDDVFRRLQRLGEAGDEFDLIYLDPPFTVKGIFVPVMEALSKAAVLAHNGIAAIRTPKDMELPGRIVNLTKAKLKQYGTSCVHFFSSVEDTT